MVTTKDPIITVRSTMRNKDSKGRDVLVLYIGGEGERNAGQIDTLIAALTAAKANPSGIKLKIHTEKKEHNGRAFDSSFFFVASVNEAPSGRGPVTFREKTPATTQAPAETASAVAKFRSQQLKG
jgi:hypothetical protein